MKKSLFLAGFAFILMITAVEAQQKPFVFGFKVAPNIGWMNPDPKEYKRDGASVGFAWGFIAEFHLMENYAILTGFDVAYVYSGMEFPYTMEINQVDQNGTLNRFYKLKYIEVPIALKMRTNEFGKFRFYGVVGLGTSFLIDGKADDEFKYPGNSMTEKKVDIYDKMTFMRESLIIEAGLEYLISGSTILHFGPKFDNGFTNILKGDDKATNNYFEFSIGIVF